MPHGLRWRKHADGAEGGENRRKTTLAADGMPQRGRNDGKLPSPGAVPDCSPADIRCARTGASHCLGVMVIAAGDGETDYVRATAPLRCGNRDVFGGMTIKDNQDDASGKTGADAKDSRRDRLKLALRENLKRRKSQARGRSDAASSENDDASLDTAGGKS